MYYQPLTTLPPLDNDSPDSGKPSDHLIVYMPPIDATHHHKRNTKLVTFRPLPESGIAQFGNWLRAKKWETVLNAVTAHEKAEILQGILMENLDKYLPMKT